MLRRFIPEDHDAYVEMNRDPGVRQYFPGLLTQEESLAELTRIEHHWEIHGFGPWALDVRGGFAGMLGLKWAPAGMPFAPAVELLYRLIPRFWGQGFATAGSLAALEFGFCELRLDTVVAFAVNTKYWFQESHGKDRNGLSRRFRSPVNSRTKSPAAACSLLAQTR